MSLADKALIVRVASKVWTARRFDRTASDEVVSENSAISGAARVNNYLMAGADAELKRVNTIVRELRDYIDKGPIVALREKILKSMNLTEEKLKAMTPDQQNAVEAEIARKVKEYLLEQQEAAKNPTSPQQAQARLLAYQAMHTTPK